MTQGRTEPTPVPSEPTISRYVRRAITQWPDRVAFRVKRDGQWEPVTFADYGAAVRACAGGLMSLGLNRGEVGAILSSNRPEWHVADFGLVTAGLVSVPIYTTSSPAQVHYVLDHSGAVLAVVEDQAQRAKVEQVRDQLPSLRHCVVLDGSGADGEFWLSWDELIARGEAHLSSGDEEWHRRIDEAQPEDLLAVIYTSGTTGPPKGAMLSHANGVFVIASLDVMIESAPGSRKLSFLPLSHVGERNISEYLQLEQGFEIWFNESMETLGADLVACRPHVQFTVPRVLEKQYAALRGALAGRSDEERTQAQRWLDAGWRRAQLLERQQEIPADIAELFARGDAALFARFRAMLGYDELQLLYSGGAPLQPEVLQFFQSIGVPLVELYGQTEVSGPLTLNRTYSYRLDSVGQVIPGGDIRIAEEGEILYRGDNVCVGYHRDPEATAELIDADGWLHTGDVGSLDEDGFLRITDRKKDLLITSGGKNIAPQLIEARLKFSPHISQAIVVGDRQRFVAALISLEEPAVRAMLPEEDAAAPLEELHRHPAVLAAVQEHVDAVNRELSHAEQVKQFRILPEDLTIAGGLLTPTMKPRRRQVTETYAAVLAEMYTDGADAVPSHPVPAEPASSS